MQVYKLLMRAYKPFDYENLIKLELNTDILGRYELDTINDYGAVIGDTRIGDNTVVIYYDCNTTRGAWVNPKFKEIIKTHNRINKLKELQD